MFSRYKGIFLLLRLRQFLVQPLDQNAVPELLVALPQHADAHAIDVHGRIQAVQLDIADDDILVAD